MTTSSSSMWFANCHLLSDNPAETAEIFTDTNISSNWRQGVACFTAPANYNRLLIYGRTNALCGILTLIDRVDIIPDIFPPQQNNITATCFTPTVIGDPNMCTAANITHFSYQWFQSPNCNNTWIPMPGETNVTLTLPPSEHTDCQCYMLQRTYQDANAPFPPASQTACINRTATYTVCTDCCLSPPSSNFSVPNDPLCLDDPLWNLNPDNPNGTWSGLGIVQNHQFNPAQGPGTFELTYTVSEPECPPSSTTAPISIDPACCMDNLNFTVTNATAVPQITTIDGRAAYVVASPAGLPANINWNSNNHPFMLPPFNLNGNDPVLFATDLVIPAGITLTITDLQLFFSYKNRILVQRGGRLNLSGTPANPTLLTGLCNIVWQGIQVEGPGSDIGRDTNPIQFFNYGTLLIENNVTIEHALFGAVGMRLPLMMPESIDASIMGLANPIIPASSGIYNPTAFYAALNAYTSSFTAFSTAGGVIVSRNNAIFRNCFEGIHLSWYKNHYCNPPAGTICQSVITNTNFISDGNMPYPFNVHPDIVPTTEAGIHCILYSILNISNNVFVNSKYGIRNAVVSDFVIQGNSIANCNVGISLVQNLPTFTGKVSVTSNSFENCDVSLQASRAVLKITNNTINQNTFPNSIAQFNQIGFFLLGSDFDAKDNLIYRVKRGAVLLSNDVESNILKRNTFSTVLSGIWLLGNNTGTDIVCNTFENYGNAIQAYNYTINGVIQEWGTLGNQGNCDPLVSIGIPADNRFLPSSIYANSLIANIPIPPDQPASFTYYYRNTGEYVPQNFPVGFYGTAQVAVCLNSTLIHPEDNCTNDHIIGDDDIINLTDKRDAAMRNKVRYYTDNNDTVSARALLEAVNSYVAKRLLLPYYAANRDTVLYDSLLLALPNSRLEEQQFEQMQNIYAHLRRSAYPWQLSSEQESIVRTIAATYTATSFDARNLLQLLYGEEYPILLPPIPGEEEIMGNFYINFKKLPTMRQPVVEVYPNPAKNFIEIHLKETASIIQHPAQLTLTDITGRKVLQADILGNITHLPIENLQAGLYFWQLTQTGNAVTESGKLIIAK